MNRTRYYIRTILLMLLLVGGGMVNDALAKKVTYHILTKPFTVKNHDNNGDFAGHVNIRVEALQCVSEEATIGLPEQFKSPLAKNFKYWANATSTYDKLYDSGYGTQIVTTKYYIYSSVSNEIENPGETSSDSYTDIYVTYDYINDGEAEGYKNPYIELDGATKYNISITSGGTQKHLAYNRSRNNRIANVNDAALTGEHLANDDFVIPEEGTGANQLGFFYSKWGPIGLFFGFKLAGQDPYNISLETSYEGGELHITDKAPGDNTGTIKPLAGASLFSKLGNTQMWFDASNNMHYKIESGYSSASDYTPEKYERCKTLWENASAADRAENWVGYYRNEFPTLNSYVLLTNTTNGGYMLVASKANQGNGSSTKPTINQPDNNNQYYSYYDAYDNDAGKKRSQPYFKLQALSSALPINFYEIKSYTVHVTTKGSGTELTETMKWSDARLSDNPAEHIPEALKRKYVTYTAYSDATHTKPVTTFKAIQDANNGMNIYLDYTVSESMPFETLPADGNYQNARWYTMRMDGVSNPKYIAYEGTSNSLVVTDGSGDAKGSNTASQIHQGEVGEDAPNAMVTFMGDPYELKILNRKACETDPAGNKFIGCPAASSVGTNLTTNNATSDITTWEIVYESTGVDGFLLRKFKTANAAEGEETKPTPKYIGLGLVANNKPVTYSATESRIRVVELEKKKYAFHIMRIDGTMAIMATTSEDVGKALKGDYTDIPDIIRSPYLSTATVNFYDTKAKATSNDPAVKITNLPYVPDNVKEGVYANIYVRYSFDSAPAVTTYNVRVNSEYIYTDGDGIKSKTNLDPGDPDDPDDDDANKGEYQWTFNLSDPYALTIHNAGNGKYVNIASWNDEATIGWSETASLFIAKSGSLPNTREVMAATGDEVDASTTYYNIGRPEANTVRLYENSSYLSGNLTLRFQLTATTASDVTYHLVDMYNNVLLDAHTRQALTENPAFPPEYYSPLVGKYYYHKTEAHAKENRTTGDIADNDEINQTNIWVTYDVNDLVDLKAGQLYLLKYEAGQYFNQEDGSDGVNPTAQKAVYPYVNGDGNFFVYGQEQYELQQEGASSTRTRWAWYVESNVPGAPKGDPYHVTIKSRQTESYPITNSSEYNAYFMTYQPDGHNEVITTLGWPGMNSETATEYMVLGSEGQYQLVTTNEIGGSRYVVDSFEQYWKTWDTIRKKVLGDSSAKENDSDPITVPETDKDGNPTATATAAGKNNRTYLSEIKGWHHYEKWAYAKRWNGYNNGYSSTEGTHETKKGWETIEHWYQTVDMGEGYFDFVKTDINPVLILLDQHGWEIMRKPLPTSPDDLQKEVKYAEIRPYNSPMVKEYAFWATAKKRSGFHQYYLLSDRIGDDDFVSTDLTSLPPYGSKNVKDKKGNLNDQYVTYIVKDEYAQTYKPSDKSAKPFLIEQGSVYASASNGSDGAAITKNTVPVNGMIDYITNNAIVDAKKWYVKPNTTIDTEMGYSDAAHTWTDPDDTDPKKWKNKNPNAYDHYKFKDSRVASYISDEKLTDSLGYFSFSNGFDPYNIQIESVGTSTEYKYMKTNANGAELHEGSIIGSYPTNPGTITMGDNTGTISPNPKWYDSRNLSVTNATFMAVQDASGNMQLMPRFDHATRMSEFGTLIAPTDAQVATTYTKLYRPEVYEYLIIDNDGHESLRYKAGGDMTPQTPDHFQSPLATNFTYYATASYDDVTKKYSGITNEIEESLDGATLTDNKVYVRYEYNEESDVLNMLKGNWLTMQLDEKNAIYDNGEVDVHIKQGTPKPATIDASEKAWQWKFLETPQSTPDPYALYIYNRSQTAGTKAIADRFALLSHSKGDYALAKAGRGDYDYYFLNGSGMNETTDATIAVESDFTPTAGTYSGTDSQVKLTDDVQHTFIYKVYTNDGVNAIDASQTQETVHSNDWKPVLPEAARTPLLNIDQYLYYENMPTNEAETLSYLYGLYDDVVYTHYTAYNPDVSNYLVPNVRNDKDADIVAPGLGSNDAPVGLDGKRPYNIIWHADNMMKSDGTSITSVANQELQPVSAFEWEFEGDDPYAIKIKSVGESGKYIHEKDDDITSTELSATATPFMLLNKDGHDYGVFAKTGDATTMLSGCGDALTTSNPTEFIPFALSTYKVIYHLMIKNIGSKGVIIPYRENNTVPYDPAHPELIWTKIKEGTTLRDLESKGSGDIAGDYYQLGVSLKSIQTESSGLFQRDSIYCYDAGHISLGDAFEVPQVFYRPNVNYEFYIEGVYSYDGKTAIAAMDEEYKGLKMNHLGEDSGLLGNIVFVNIVYNFMGGLDTNSGSDFVKSVSQNKWYTYETSGATPMLAECTGTTTLKTVSGYATHYTNDYLWTPVGDPYGFKMYNRYLSKNLKRDMVMSTSALTSGTSIAMDNDNSTKPHLPANSVYELLSNSSTTPGYFRIHPVANRSDQAQSYMNNNASTGAMTLNTTATEWTFGLSEEVMRPYSQAAGYVGGLNDDGKKAYDIIAAETDPSKMLKKLMDLQDVVYNHDNDGSDPEHPNYIVHYTPGYYRLHNQPGSSGITTPRYASGYTHLIESTDYDNDSSTDSDGDGSPSTDVLPLHFYEVEKYDVNNPTFRDLESGQYTSTNATRGDIPLVTVDKDPASIFQFEGETTTGVKLSTQGLYVKGNKMTATVGDATSFDIVDIGAGVVALQQHEGDNFLKYAQNEMKYDLKFDNNATTVESARWCMKPVQKRTTAGDGEMALKVATNNGGDDYYYTTFYAPFDVLLTSTNDIAYIVPKDMWPDMTTSTTQYVMHPKRISGYNTEANGCPEDYRDQFIPAGTPVIIRTKNTGGEVTMVLPNATATLPSPITTDLRGEYLEQMLAQSASDYVFVLGRSYLHSNDFRYDDPSKGEVTPAGLEVDKGVGFYKNASNNRESSATKTMWTRNNKYVYANKIYYYRPTEASSPSPAPKQTHAPEFIPVVFDDDEGEQDEELKPDGTREVIGDGCVYDLMGRKVATREQVEDGSWKQRVATGIYIINGKKIRR